MAVGAGPEAILIATVLIRGWSICKAVASPRSRRRAGTDPKDTLFDILVEDAAQTTVAVFAMSEPTLRLPRFSLGSFLQR